jgi:hypothetical protein
VAGPSWDDLDEFIDTDDFAVSAIVTPKAGGSSRVVKVIYDDPYLNAQLGEYDADISRPRIMLKESDSVGIKRGDTVTIDGTIFDVMTEPQADGNGLAMLDLARQPKIG